MSTQKKSVKATKTTIVVNVSESHIKSGVQESHGKCPIALALRSMRYTKVSVAYDCLFANRGKSQFFGELPIRAQKFIGKFDKAQPVKPFSFRIKVEQD